jgi:hypothetical protein
MLARLCIGFAMGWHPSQRDLPWCLNDSWFRNYLNVSKQVLESC